MEELRSPEELASDTLAYGLCESCSTPRSVRRDTITPDSEPRTVLTLWCPACGWTA